MLLNLVIFSRKSLIYRNVLEIIIYVPTVLRCIGIQLLKVPIVCEVLKRFLICSLNLLDSN